MLNATTFHDALKQAQEARIRADKRAEKAKTLWTKVKRVKRKKLPSMARMKKMAWEALSLFVRARDAVRFNGKCAICRVNHIECAYHLIPASEGAGVKWDAENIVGACFRCNYMEHRFRMSYTLKHMSLFGADKIMAIHNRRNDIVQYKRHHYAEMIVKYTQMRLDIERGIIKPCI